MTSDRMLVAPEPDRWLGRIVGGRYRLDKLIAQGGMGRIYRATQLTLGRCVAVKMLLAQGDAAAQKVAAQRFVYEAAAAAKCHHPHSVTVLDYGSEQDGTAFLVMELLEGRTLGQLLRHHGRLEVYRALAIAKQTAAALCAAHAQNVVHRDLKPSNLFMFAVPQAQNASGAREAHDYVKVVDFGLAKPCVHKPSTLTVSGRLIGSPGYMAPEQIRGESTDHRCDIYALGAILFEMLTGAAPYAKACVYETLVAQVHEPLPTLAEATSGSGTKPCFNDALETLVSRAMAKDPADRFQTMVVLHAALEELLSQRSTGARKALPFVVHSVASAQGDRWQEVSLGRGQALWGSGVSYGPPPHAYEVRRRGQLLLPSKPPASVWRSPFRALRRAPRAYLAVLGILAVFAGVAPRAWKVTQAAWSRRAPVHARLDSVPAGAAVWLGNRQLCRETPCAVTLRPSLLRQHVSLRFVHPRFDEFVATRRLEGQSLAVVAPLDGDAKQSHEHLHQNEAHDGELDAHGLL